MLKRWIKLGLGIICAIAGLVMARYQVGPNMVAVMLGSTGGALIGVSLLMRGGVRDEMVKRIDALSAYYAYNASLYCLFTLCFIHYFSPVLSSSMVLLTMLLFMSLSFVLFRYVLLKRGTTE